MSNACPHPLVLLLQLSGWTLSEGQGGQGCGDGVWEGSSEGGSLGREVSDSESAHASAPWSGEERKREGRRGGEDRMGGKGRTSVLRGAHITLFLEQLVFTLPMQVWPISQLLSALHLSSWGTVIPSLLPWLCGHMSSFS